MKEQFACRYNEQDLTNVSSQRPSDYCDYSSGVHYHSRDIVGKQECIKSSLNFSLSIIKYPDDFISNAKYMGIDHVGQGNCHHFYSPSVRDGSKYYGMDLWFTTEGEKLPCLITLTDTTSNPFLIQSFAFDGMTVNIPSSAMQKCQFPRTTCIGDNYVCNVKKNADTVAVVKALQWVCGSGALDCTPINQGGDHYFPNDLKSHANWAFNEYYQNNKDKQGNSACNFGGTAELVPPSNTTSSLPSENGFLRNLSSLYLFDIVCA